MTQNTLKPCPCCTEALIELRSSFCPDCESAIAGAKASTPWWQEALGWFVAIVGVNVLLLLLIS